MKERRALASLPCVAILVALAALAARGPAFVSDPTPDAVENQLLARSLARGEGFVLPVRVRHDTLGVDASVRHEASGERAPLFPWFLAGLERLGLDRGEGRVSPGLQVGNALVGALDAVLVAALAWALARRHGRVRAGLALVAGLAVAWSPPLIQGSCRLLAEPLGLVFVLLTAHAEVRLARGESGANARTGALAFAGGLGLVVARLARPEVEVVLWLVVGARVAGAVRGSGGRAGVAALGGTLLAVAVDLAVARAGWAPPQGFLLRVGSFNDVMFDWGAAPPVASSAVDFVTSHAGEVAGKIAGNLVDLGYHALRYATVIPLLAVLAVVRGSAAALRVLGLAWAFVLVTGGVWATRDHARFLVIPLALATAPAVVEGWRVVRGLARRWAIRSGAKDRRRLRRVRRTIAGLVLVATAAPLIAGVVHGTWRAHERANAVEGDSTWGGPELDAIAAQLRALPQGEAFAAVSPWGLALASGRDGVLLPVHLEGPALVRFLAAYPTVRVVVVRPAVPHDRLTPEPVAYPGELAAIGSSESVGGATWVRLR